MQLRYEKIEARQIIFRHRMPETLSAYFVRHRSESYRSDSYRINRTHHFNFNLPNSYPFYNSNKDYNRNLRVNLIEKGLQTLFISIEKAIIYFPFTDKRTRIMALAWPASKAKRLIIQLSFQAEISHLRVFKRWKTPYQLYFV